MLVAEVLACNIRCHPDISGLTLSGSSVSLPPLSQYADDTSIIVTSDRAILATFEVYDLYQQGSGAKLNLSKCKGLWLGLGMVASIPRLRLSRGLSSLRSWVFFLVPWLHRKIIGGRVFLL